MRITMNLIKFDNMKPKPGLPVKRSGQSSEKPKRAFSNVSLMIRQRCRYSIEMTM